MSTTETLLVGLVMLVGLVGVVVPVLPGLALIWGATLAWVLLDGGGAARWAVLAVITALALVGAGAKYAVPGRSARGAGAPWSTLAWGGVGMVAGFFLVPVAGLLVGGISGVYGAELARLRDPRVAWTSTVAVLKAVGIGVLVELVAAMLMVATWALGAVLI